jgi:hypothetical protein
LNFIFIALIILFKRDSSPLLTSSGNFFRGYISINIALSVIILFYHVKLYRCATYMINIDKYLRYITLFNSFENYHKVNWKYIAMTVIIENYHKVNWKYIAMTVIIENYHKVNWRYIAMMVIIENYHKVNWKYIAMTVIIENYHRVN